MNKSWRNVVIGDETPVEKPVMSNTSASANTASNTSNSKTSSPSLSASNPNGDKKRHERLLVVYSPLVGSRVTVFLYDGAVFEGTLHSFETENEFALILRMATMMRPGREVIDPIIKAGVTFELMNIRFDDMAELKAAAASSSNGGIGTDAAISKKKGDFGKERELHRWLPEDGDLPTLNTSDNNTQWDQFATNEKLFGLKTDFNEELYTTKLDRNSAHIRANEANAERIAKEIMMASTGGNVHLAEERGQKFEGCDDEEMLYGAVVRDSKKGSALPPGFTSATNKEAKATSTLNPAAPEFKLSIDAPEFIPSAETVAKVTYYNQPRRNLYNYQQVYAYGYPQSYPYYYVPPEMSTMNVNVPNAHFPSVNVPSVNVPSVNVPSVNVPSVNVPNDHVPSSSTSQSQMNPNAADFVMPQYYMPPQQPHYYQGQGGYYHHQY